MMSVEVKAHGISKRFGDNYAVKDLEFQVQPGELFALLGPSGAGKTTTLNMIAGIETPDAGDILLNGMRINHIKPQDRDFAMVFESYALYPHFTVEENISFPLKARGRQSRYAGGKIKEIVAETAKMLEIEELLQRYPRELSGGQKQRVGLGRALVRRPRLFLLDEPIAHLDAKLRHHMRGELKKLQKNLAITTILATPDYNEVVAMADRAAVLSSGSILQIGTPLELFKEPCNETVAKSIGDPPINLIACEVVSDNDATVLRKQEMAIEIKGPSRQKILKGGCREVNLGIRPRDITIQQDPHHGMMPAEVYVFEPLGSAAVATLIVADIRIKVLCAQDSKLKIGQQVGLSFNLEKMYLFDPETGKALPDS